MADKKLVKILRQSVEAWSKWREENPGEIVDLIDAALSGAALSGANLSGADLSGADLSGANLSRADLSDANLRGADLSRADLNQAFLIEADLSGANLSRAGLNRANLRKADLSDADVSRAGLNQANLNGAKLFKAKLSLADLSLASLSEADLGDADLRGAKLNVAYLNGARLSGANLRGAKLCKAKLSLASLSEADLSKADLSLARLSGADLSGADLKYADLVETNLGEADLTGIQVYGASIWKVNLEGAKQQDIVITDDGEPKITVDDLEVAQFIYVLLYNERLRYVLDAITRKVVLILGRFTEKRKATLDALRDALRQLDFSPVMFDFKKPKDRTLTETVKTLAQLARFVIVDFTAARSVQQELQATVPTLAIPFVPIIKKGRKPWGMAKDFKLYHWVLPLHTYEKKSDLLVDLEQKLIPAANEKRKELRRLKDY